LIVGGPISDTIAKLRDDFSAEKQKLDDLRQKKWEETKVQRDKERAAANALREEKNKQWEARKAEREKNTTTEDGGAKTPYDGEIYLCEELIKYLNTLLPKKTAAATTTAAAAVPEAGNVTVLKKDDDEGDFAGKKKAKKQKPVKVSIQLVLWPLIIVLTWLIGYPRPQAQYRSVLTV
jgi:hypothetical protein